MTPLGLLTNHPGLGLLASLRRDELDWYVYSGANSTRRATLCCVYKRVRKRRLLNIIGSQQNIGSLGSRVTLPWCLRVMTLYDGPVLTITDHQT